MIIIINNNKNNNNNKYNKIYKEVALLRLVVRVVIPGSSGVSVIVSYISSLLLLYLLL